MADPRTSRAYRAHAEKMKRIHGTCYRCGKPIDRSLPNPHPMSWTLEHVQELDAGGEALDPANSRGSHLRCNSRAGNEYARRKHALGPRTRR